MTDLVQKLVIKVNADGTLSVTKLAEDLDKVGQSGKAAGAAVNEGFLGAAAGARGLVTELAAVVGVTLSVQAAFSALKEAINFSDQIRDVGASFTALERSSGAGAESLAKFRAMADGTRNTALELARAFQEALPTAMRRGIGDATLSSLTVQLAKIAPLLNTTLEGVMGQWEQIMSGRVRKTNMLANLLTGGDEDLMKDLMSGGNRAFGPMFAAIDKYAARGEALGQTFESVFKKIKDSMLDAFAEGFAGGEKGYQGILDAFKSPEILNAIKTIGEAIREWLPILAKAAEILGVIAGVAFAKPGRGTATVSMGGTGFEDLGFVPGPEAVGMGDVKGYERATEAVKKFSAEVKNAKDPIKNLSEAIASAFNPEKFQEFDDAVNRFLSRAQVLLPLSEKLFKVGVDAQSLIDRANAQIDALPHGLLDKDAAQYVAEINRIIEGVGQIREALMDDAVSNFWAKQIGEANKYRQALADIKDSTRDTFLNIPVTGGTAIKDLERLFANAQAAMQNQIEVGGGPVAMEGILAGFREGVKLTETSAKRESDYQLAQLQKAARAFQNVFESFEASLTDSLLTGGKNVGEIMAQAFGQNVSTGIRDLFEKYIDPLLGISKDKQGNYIVNGVSVGKDRQAAIGAAAQGEGSGADLAKGIGFAGIAVGSYSNRGMSDLSAVISGAITGAQIAGWIGAVVGAVLAEVGKLLQPSVGSTYQYATGIGTDNQGQFGGRPNANIDANTWKTLVAQGQKAFNEFFDGYSNLATKLLGVTPEISKAFSAIYGKFEQGADLGLAASQKFGQELQSYLTSGLPHQIADRFSKYIQSGFETLGFSAGRFAEIWRELSNLDPAKQLSLLNDLADAAISFKKSMDFFTTPTMGQGVFGEGGLFQQIATKDSQTFAQSLQEGDDKIVQLAASLDGLSIEGQIAGFKEISNLMDERYQKEVAYLQKIMEIGKAITASIDKQMSDIRLASMLGPNGQPDTHAQINYLFQQLQVAGEAIKAATSPEMVQQATSKSQELIGQILQIGGAQGPEALKAYQGWALDQLKKLEDAGIARLQAIGNLDDLNTRLANAISKFIDDFETAAGRLSGSTGTGTGTGGGGGETPEPTYQPVVGAVGEVNTTLMDIRDILRSGQNIKIDLSDHEVNVHVDLTAGGDSGGGTGNLSTRVIRGRAA